MTEEGKRALYALALGGGAARGFAHLGVLEAFEREGIAFDMIVGTSMGALVGGLYASGVPLVQIERAVVDVPWKRMVSYFRPRVADGGLIDAKAVVKVLRTLLGDARIENFPVSFAAVAADVRTGERIIFREGSAVTAIRASISLPGMFAPVVEAGRALVDGGVVEPVPVPTARELGATRVLAVNVLDHPAKRNYSSNRSEPNGNGQWQPPSRQAAAESGEWHDKVLAFAQRLAHRRREKRVERGRGPWLGSILWSSLRIIQYTLAEYQTRQADILIEPQLGDVLPSEFYRGRECVAAGRRAAVAVMGEARALFGKDSSGAS